MSKFGSEAVNSEPDWEVSQESEVDIYFSSPTFRNRDKPSKLMSIGHDLSDEEGSEEKTHSGKLMFFGHDLSDEEGSEEKTHSGKLMSIEHDLSDEEGSEEKTHSGWAKALEDFDIEAIRRFISEGVDVNSKVKVWSVWLHSSTMDLPLHLAAMGSLETTRLLLEAGARVDETCAFTGTALQRAIKHARSDEQRLATVQLLLRYGADVNATPGASGTALVAASELQKIDVLRFLIESGADVNKYDGGNYTTALAQAAGASRLEAVRFLLDNGAKPNTPIKYLYQDNALVAASKVSETMVKWLLDAGADPNAVTCQNQPQGVRSALAVAARAGNLSIVKLLLRHKANIDAVDHYDGSAVIAAALKGHLEISLWLLEHGADARDLASQWQARTVKEDKKPIPDELIPWCFAAELRLYETAESLLRELPLSVSHGFSEVKWQWELPDFIEANRGTPGPSEGFYLDYEIIPTAAKARNSSASDNEQGAQYFRIFTWITLVETHLSRMPEVPAFLAGILRHVSTCLEDIKADCKVYAYHLGDSDLSVRLRCNWTAVTAHFSDDVPDSARDELLWALEILCKAFRKMGTEQLTSISKSCWWLEKYQVPADEIPAEKVVDAGEYGPLRAIRISMNLFDKPLKVTQHGCWQRLFRGGCNVLDLGGRASTDADEDTLPIKMRKGLETDFEMMLLMTAVEYPVVVDGGVVFVGYETVVVPIEIDESTAQFHLLTNDNAQGQINPYKMDLGPRLITEDFRLFQNKRCFLGWCELAQINLGTLALPAHVKYSKGREKGKSIQLDGITLASQFGLSQALSALFRVEANFNRTSHRLHFTAYGGYAKLLYDTARELAIVYDAGAKRCWLVPKLSLLLHMSHAYALSLVDGSADNVPFVDCHADAGVLIESLKLLGDDTVLGGSTNGLLFRQLLLGLNTNLLATTRTTLESAHGTLYGFEFMDVVTAPGRGSFMKKLDVKSPGRNWLAIVNAVDAVVVCAGIGDVITASAAAPTATTVSNGTAAPCRALPDGLDYLAATIPCLSRLAQRRGSEVATAATAGATPSQRVRISEDIYWDPTGDPFKACAHGGPGGASETCWMRTDLLQQCTPNSSVRRFLQGGRRGSEPVALGIPHSGAVAFGG